MNLVTSADGILDTEHVDPDEAWLRGYFSVERSDSGVLGSARFKKKSIDFLRLRDVALHMLDPRPGMKILDVGCANGPTMIYCGLQGATMSGIDMDPEAVAGANRMMKRYGVDGAATCGDATSLPFPDASFDGVISSDFLEHVTDDVKVSVLREMGRVLKPGCKVITKTPNLSYAKLSLRFRQLRALSRFQNPLALVIPHTPGTEDPQHIGLTSRWPFRDCLVKAGFYNYEFAYAPLRRFGMNKVVEVLSTEVPVLRDMLCEDLFAVAWKPIVLSHFPD